MIGVGVLDVSHNRAIDMCTMEVCHHHKCERMRRPQRHHMWTLFCLTERIQVIVEGCVSCLHFLDFRVFSISETKI